MKYVCQLLELVMAVCFYLVLGCVRLFPVSLFLSRNRQKLLNSSLVISSEIVNLLGSLIGSLVFLCIREGEGKGL